MGGNPAASPREGLPKSRPRGAGHARPRSVRPHSVAPVIGWWAGAARRRPSSGRRSRLVWTDRVHGTNCCGRAAPGTRAGLCSRLPPGRRRNREVGASMTKRPPSPRHYGGRVARGAAARAAVALAPGGVRLPGRAEPDPRHRDHRRRRRSAARPADPGSGLPPPEIGRDPLQDDDRYKTTTAAPARRPIQQGSATAPDGSPASSASTWTPTPTAACSTPTKPRRPCAGRPGPSTPGAPTTVRDPATRPASPLRTRSRAGPAAARPGGADVQRAARAMGVATRGRCQSCD